MQSWQDLGCVPLPIRQGLLSNGCKSLSAQGPIWGRKLRRKHASVERSPPMGALLALSSSTSTAQRWGEAGRRGQSLKPHHSFCNLNSNAFELGRTLCYKCCHHSLPVISKMSGFCATLSYSLGHFPVCIV